jgi:hypothetical protein
MVKTSVDNEPETTVVRRIPKEGKRPSPVVR